MDGWPDLPVAELPVPALPKADPEPAPTKIIVAAAEPTPPPPKHKTLRLRRSRFTWESPEMYWEEATD